MEISEFGGQIWPPYLNRLENRPLQIGLKYSIKIISGPIIRPLINIFMRGPQGWSSHTFRGQYSQKRLIYLLKNRGLRKSLDFQVIW